MTRTPGSERRRFLGATAAAAAGLCPPLVELVSAARPAVAAVDLTPGHVMTLTFPELPKTLRAVNDPGASGPTSISVRLPDNYSKERTFPMCVFLHGGQGGLGSEVDLPMQVVGKNDYVVATFPLFKMEINRDEQWGGVGIDFLDYPTLSATYKAFLDRIRETIPNIDPQTSMLGGYSNGGNALGVLLSALDPTTVRSFKRYFFIDSGVDWTGYQRYKSLGDHDILFVMGGGKGEGEWARPYMLSRIAYYKEVAQRYHATRWQFVVVDGATHGDLDQYFTHVRRWAARRGAAGKAD